MNELAKSLCEHIYVSSEKGVQMSLSRYAVV